MAGAVGSVVPEAARPGGHTSGQRKLETFFVGYGAALLALTLLGFLTTYLLPMAAGRFSGPPVLHLHGVLFLAWPALFFVQTLTVSYSRRWHRGLGLFGISLATAMLFSGLLAIGSSIRTWEAQGVGLPAQAISLVAFSGLVLFCALFALAIVHRRDRAAHSRYMAIATLAIMQGAWGRLALVAVTGGNPGMLRPGLLQPPEPALVAVTHLLLHGVFLAILAAHDWRISRRVHRATLIGGALLLTVVATRHLFVDTAAWAEIARWIVSLSF